MLEPIWKLERTNNLEVKAFKSLSFRGKRGYIKNTMMRNMEERQKTYGGIIRVKYEGGYKYGLVQGRYTGKWSFPKGHINEGETGIECTLREILEETGIEELPKAKDFINVGYGNYFVFEIDEEVKMVARDKKEIIDTKWVTLEEMEKMLLNADVSIYLREQKKLL